MAKIEYTYFWGGPFGNWYESPYILDGVKFSCAEQGMMYEKAKLFDPHGKEIHEIMSTSDPKKIKAIGRRVKYFDDAIWTAKREELFYPHLIAKFRQNSGLKTALLRTGPTILVEASPYDSIWGIGYSKEKAPTIPVSEWGQNILGKLLTRLRAELA